MRCSDTVFYVYLRNWLQSLSKCLSTELLLETFYVKYCSVLLQNQKIYLNLAASFLSKHKKLYRYISFLWDFVQPKMSVCNFLREKIPKSTLFNTQVVNKTTDIMNRNDLLINLSIINSIKVSIYVWNIWFVVN